MNAAERDAMLVRMDERMKWLVDEHTKHRADYAALIKTVENQGMWIHAGKLVFIIAGGAILAKDYVVNWVNGLKP